MQDRLYGADFMNGVETLHPYPVHAIPVGSRVTILHFSNGYFYKRVDLTASRRGFAVDRIMCCSPSWFVLDCRAIRKAKKQGGVVEVSVRQMDSGEEHHDKEGE